MQEVRGGQLSQFTEVSGGALSKQSTAEQNIKEAKWKASRLSGERASQERE